MNRKYELMVIYRAEDDNGYQEGNDWVTEKVQSYQGQVTKLDPWGLRRLAYPLKSVHRLITACSRSSCLWKTLMNFLRT